MGTGTGGLKQSRPANGKQKTYYAVFLGHFLAGEGTGEMF